MASITSLEFLSIQEKLALMEELWADLSRQPADITTPAWHGGVLAERIAAVQAGQIQFGDWEAAKERLRKRCS
ncbi:MAG: addiction module protein [Pirellulales bacterium]|nr:addiction module protein [Pirellulales bacterium]